MVISRWKRGSVAACCAAFGALLLASGCDDLFGFERSGDIVQCVHDRDCDNGLVCANNRCTAGCGDTTSSVDNCGACGNACTGNHVNWACAHSTCIPNGCAQGWGDCNGDSNDGCEANLLSDALNCSRCNDACASTVCSNGGCLERLTVGPATLPSSGAANIEVDPSMTDPGLSELFGIQITVSQPAVLLNIGIVTSYGGPQGYLGLYQDLGGNPTTLVASTNEFTLLGNPTMDDDPLATEISVPPVNLQPGAYWILGMWTQSVFIQMAEGAQGCLPDDAGCISWYEVPQPFADSLPTSVQAMAEYPYGPTPDMYITVAQ